MSVHLKVSELTKEQKLKIRNDLILEPIKTDFELKKFNFNTNSNIVQFYYVNIKKDIIILPYNYGNNIKNKIINKNQDYIIRKFKFIGKLRNNQIDVTQKALNYLKSKGTVTLGLYPGFGKTVISSYLSSKINGIILVIFNRNSLLKQWETTYKNFTNAKCCVVDNKKNNINSDSFFNNNYNVILCMNKRINYIPKDIVKNIKCLILDEAHMYCTNGEVKTLLFTQPLFIIICSATLNKKVNGMQKMIHHLSGTHGIFKSSEKPFDVFKVETGVKLPIPKNIRGDINWAQLVKDIAFNDKRNNIILDIVLKNLHHKIIILTWNKNHAFFIKDLLLQNNVNVDVLAGNIKMYSDSNVLVGTISKIGTGFDEATFCKDFKGIKSNLMILAGSTKNQAGLEQFTGRVFRSDFPIIYDLVDDLNIFLNHWRIRYNWYLNHNGVIKICNDYSFHNSKINKFQNIHLEQLKFIRNKYLS